MMSTFFRSLCPLYHQWAFLLSVKAKMFQAHLVLSCPKIWCQLPSKATKDEMAGWHHWLDGRESGWTPGVGDGQGGLACYDSWGRKELDTTERLIWTEPSKDPWFLLVENSLRSQNLGTRAQHRSFQDATTGNG